MRYLKTYLRDRLPAVGIFLLFSLIFLTVFALYRLPMAAVLYPVGLCGVLARPSMITLWLSGSTRWGCAGCWGACFWGWTSGEPGSGTAAWSSSPSCLGR